MPYVMEEFSVEQEGVKFFAWEFYNSDDVSSVFSSLDPSAIDWQYRCGVPLALALAHMAPRFEASHVFVLTDVDFHMAVVGAYPSFSEADKVLIREEFISNVSHEAVE